MKRLALLALALSSTALAQSAAVPDLRAARNAASRAETACSKNTQQAKCKLETDTLLRHAQNAHAIVNPTPTPTPVPTPSPTPVPTPTPTPVPTPTPTPSPSTGYVPSPSLTGGPALVASFNVNEALQASWGTGAIPGLYGGGEGAFRFTCGGEGELRYDDPLLYPGQPDESHLHKFFGANGVNYATTMSTLANTASSTCNYGTKVVNRSAYWMPALLDDQGYVRNPDWIAVYYKRPMASNARCTPGSPTFQGTCLGLPNQIRFIGGWDPTDPNGGSPGSSWYCTGSGSIHVTNLDELFQAGCKAGDTLVADISFPNCWDGTYLDTPDHREHVAFAGYGDWGYLKCPVTHPYVIPQTENKYAWTVTADMYSGTPGTVGASARILLASDHMKTGADPGETLHGDYMERWVSEVKAMWLAGCINGGLDCSGGDLGNGLQVKGASQPQYGWVNPNPKSSTTYTPMAP